VSIILPKNLHIYMEDKCNNPPFRGILKKGGIKDCMINHPKGRIIDTILHISGYLHTFTFLSALSPKE